MTRLGYLLITLGFLSGALASVQTSANVVPAVWYWTSFAVGALGVAAVRLAARRAAGRTDVLQVGFGRVSESLERVVRLVADLDARKDAFDPYEVHGLIDAELPQALASFADGRETIAHLHGLSVYAAIMNDFAAGERYLNRVWSASIDGYIDEIRTYLPRAREQFERAHERLQALGATSGSTPVA